MHPSGVCSASGFCFLSQVVRCQIKGLTPAARHCYSANNSLTALSKCHALRSRTATIACSLQHKRHLSACQLLECYHQSIYPPCQFLYISGCPTQASDQKPFCTVMCEGRAEPLHCRTEQGNAGEDCAKVNGYPQGSSARAMTCAL